MKKIFSVILSGLLSIVLIGCTESTSFMTRINIKTSDSTITTTFIDNNTTTSTDEITTTTNNPVTTTEGKYPKIERITEDAKLLLVGGYAYKDEDLGFGWPSFSDGFIFKSKDTCCIFKKNGRTSNYEDLGDYLREIVYDDFFDDYNILFIIYNHSSSVKDFEYKGCRIEGDTFYNILNISSPNHGSCDSVPTYYVFAVNKKFNLTKHSVDITNTYPIPSQRLDFPFESTPTGFYDIIEIE